MVEAFSGMKHNGPAVNIRYAIYKYILFCWKQKCLYSYIWEYLWTKEKLFT